MIHKQLINKGEDVQQRSYSRNASSGGPGIKEILTAFTRCCKQDGSMGEMRRQNPHTWLEETSNGKLLEETVCGILTRHTLMYHVTHSWAPTRNDNTCAQGEPCTNTQGSIAPNSPR